MGVNEFLDDSPISFDVSTTLEKNATTLFLLQKSRDHATADVYKMEFVSNLRGEINKGVEI